MPLLVVILLLIACACDGAAPRPPHRGTSRLHLLQLNKLQGFAEGFLCNPDQIPPLAGAADLRDRLRSDGDLALLVAVGDVLSIRLYEPLDQSQAIAERGRRRGVMRALEEARVDVLVPAHADLKYGADAFLDDCAAGGLTVLLSNASVPGRDDIRDRLVFEHDGLRLGALGLLPLDMPIAGGGREKIDYGEVRVTDPRAAAAEGARRLREEDGVDLVVVFSVLEALPNNDIARMPEVQLVLGSAEPRAAGGAIFDPADDRLVMGTSDHRGREVGHTTLTVVDGNFTFADVSGQYVLPAIVERDREALQSYVDAFGTDDLRELAALVEPDAPATFFHWVEMIDVNAAAIEEIARYRGSSIAHRAAELEPVAPDHPVQEALALTGTDIEGALERADLPEPRPLAVTVATPPTPDDCRACHVAQYAFWEETDHAGAFRSLAALDRHHDATCLGCHATAFNEPAGWADVRLDAPFGPVSCYSCHGTNRRHCDDPAKVMDPAHHFYGRPADMPCLDCHKPERAPDFKLARDIERVACPPLTREEPEILETYERLFEAAREARVMGVAGRRLPFFEGRAQLAVGRDEEGLRNLRSMIPLTVADPMLAIELARTFDEAGYSADAIATLKAFLELQTGEPLVNAEYVRLLLEASDPEQRDPEAALRRIRFLVPEDETKALLDFRTLEVDALMALGRRDEALSLLTRLLSDHANDGRVVSRAVEYGVLQRDG